MPGYAQINLEVPEVFAEALDLFTQVITELSDPDQGTPTHAQTEEHLHLRATELGRALYQGHLDLLARREQRSQDPVIGADQVVRTRTETGHTRSLTTLFGPVTVTRMAYRAPGTQNPAATGSPRRSWSSWAYWPTWATSACTPRRSSGTNDDAERRPCHQAGKPPTSPSPACAPSENEPTHS
jgi:hypothetical protein